MFPHSVLVLFLKINRFFFTKQKCKHVQALVGTESYYNSFVACNGQVLLLCANSIRSIGIRSWDERLDLLLSQSKLEAAIWLSLLMFDGRAKAMQAMKDNLQQRQTVLKTKVSNALYSFFHCSLPITVTYIYLYLLFLHVYIHLC